MKLSKKFIFIKVISYLIIAYLLVTLNSDTTTSFMSENEAVRESNAVEDVVVALENDIAELDQIEIEESLIVFPTDRICWHPWGFEYDCEAGYCFDENTGSYYPCGWCFNENYWRWSPCDAMCKNWDTNEWHECGACWDRRTEEYFDCEERYCWNEDWQSWDICPMPLREGLHSCTLGMLSMIPRQYGMCNRQEDSPSWGHEDGQGAILREITDLAREEFLLTGEFPELTSWRNEDGRLAHNDQCRSMRQTTASIAVREYFENTVTRTIHFVFEDGTQAAESIIQTASFESVQELISGRQYNVNDDVILPGLPLPQVSSPNPDYTVGSPSSLISPVRVLMDDDNLEKTIIFSLVKRTGNEENEEPGYIGETRPGYNNDDRVNVPNTLSAVPLWVYITGGILITSGITIILIKAKQKDIED